MNMKDQRIELRLPQQQLDELDHFIASIESQYKPPALTYYVHLSHRACRANLRLPVRKLRCSPWRHA